MSTDPSAPSPPELPRLTVTLAIPTLNEAPTIADVVAEGLPFVDEVLVVDGHSTDETRERAEAAGARVVLDPRKGKGAALRFALAEATTDVVVFMDADGSHEA